MPKRERERERERDRDRERDREREREGGQCNTLDKCIRIPTLLIIIQIRHSGTLDRQQIQALHKLQLGGEKGGGGELYTHNPNYSPPPIHAHTTSTYMHAHYTHMHGRTRMHAYMTYMHAPKQTRMYVPTPSPTPTHTRARAHTHTHAHTRGHSTLAYCECDCEISCKQHCTLNACS